MEGIRKPFQGVTNIIRFNWHFYLLTALLIVLLIAAVLIPGFSFRLYTTIFLLLVIVPILTSIAVSYYVYDLSGLYSLRWLDNVDTRSANRILNINAGFDELSGLLKARHPHTELLVFDFYDPQKHTEVSIKRARKAYPVYPGTISISTSHLPIEKASADLVFLVLAAHEIRQDEEREIFFRELSRVLEMNGRIIVTEHLRDLPNFLAYNIGFFHFLSKQTWYKTFKHAGLKVSEEIKVTPFITTFILERDGIAP